MLQELVHARVKKQEIIITIRSSVCVTLQEIKLEREDKLQKSLESKISVKTDEDDDDGGGGSQTQNARIAHFEAAKAFFSPRLSFCQACTP